MQNDFPAFPLVYRSEEKGLNHQIVINWWEKYSQKYLSRSLVYSLIERMENTDEYEEYNYDESLHSAGHSRKGKSKKEAGQNKSTGEHGQGHAGRKVVENIQHGEEKRKEENKKSEK